MIKESVKRVSAILFFFILLSPVDIGIEPFFREAWLVLDVEGFDVGCYSTVVGAKEGFLSLLRLYRLKVSLPFFSVLGIGCFFEDVRLLALFLVHLLLLGMLFVSDLLI